MKLTLPIRFKKKKKNGTLINLEDFMPLNNFFGYLIESISVLKKHDQANLTPALPSGYMNSILEHVGEEQLSVVQRDIC